jgi:hypothetical protein
MRNIWAIVTHHKDPEEAAEAWNREKVCAIGWSGYGDLRKVQPKLLRTDTRFARERQLFLDIHRDDVVIAYSKQNTIAYVGKVMNPYRGPTSDNEVGRESGFDYTHQLKVEWWPEPHHFKRSDLPSWLEKQLGRRGKTVVKLDLGKYGFDQTVEIIKKCARSRSALDEFEDLAKAGLRKYMHHKIDELEPGLEIVRAEKFTSETDKPDFTGRDKDGNTVLIECKGTADMGDCDQIEDYGKHYKAKKKPRLMLVAFEFDADCRRTARSRGIELVECNLDFKKI